MDTNLSFNVMVHTKDSQQKVDEFIKSTIVNFLKAQYKGGNFRNVSVTKNQVKQGSLFFTVFNNYDLVFYYWKVWEGASYPWAVKSGLLQFISDISRREGRRLKIFSPLNSAH